MINLPAKVQRKNEIHKVNYTNNSILKKRNAYKEKRRHHDGYFSKVLVCFLRYKKDCVVVLISSAKVLLFFDMHNSKMYV